MEAAPVMSLPKTASRSSKIDKLRERIRGKLQTTKTIDESDDGKESALLGQLEQRERRKRGVGLVNSSPMSKAIMPSAEEAYDFFTMCWDSDLPWPGALLAEESGSPLKSPSDTGASLPIEPPEDRALTLSAKTEAAFDVAQPSTSEPLPDISSVQQDPVAGTDTDDNAKLLVEDILEIEDHWQLVEFVPAVYSPFRERITRESTQCYVPSSTPVPMCEKLPQALTPRNLADEGFFVGKPPRVAARNRNKMERRLVNNKEFHWFGENGEINALPDTIDENPPCPTLPDSDEPMLQTEFRKAVVDEQLHQSGLSGQSPGNCELNIDLSQLVFNHHHLFSQEHVFAAKIRSLHGELCRRNEAATAEYLSKKLEVLRSAMASVQEPSTEETSDVDVDAGSSNRIRRLRMYRNEVAFLRQQLNREHQVDRAILKNILHTWKNMKNLRERQGYLNTSLQLQIIRKETNKASDLEEWNRDIEGELLDARQDHETRYVTEMEEYRRKLKLWKRAKSKRRSDKATSSKRLRAMAATASPSLEERLLSDNTAVGEDDEPEMTQKPEPPLPFDEGAVRERIEAWARANRRNPGEPILHPTLLNSAQITPTENCPRGEQKRRDEVSKYKIFVKILCNEKEVTKTTAKQPNNDFSIVFGEIFCLQTSQSPKSISVQIFESQPLSPVLLATVFIPLPALSANCDSRNNVHEDYEFSSSKIVRYNHHDGVGSGFAMAGMPRVTLGAETDIEVPLTHGVVRCSTLWHVDAETLVELRRREQRSVGERQDAIAWLGVRNIVDPVKLNEWIQSATLDPNDPANASLMQFIANRVSTTTLSKNYFRLEQLQEEFNFVENDDFFDSRRFKLIGLREKDIPEFRNWRNIPLRDRDIPNSVFQAHENRLKDEKRAPVLEADVDSYRAKVTEYLNKVREQVWKRHQVSRRHKELADVVTEEQIPDIGSLGTTLVQLTERRRPLRPVRKERKRVTALNVSGTSVSILVNVASALNVPVRNDSEKTGRLAISRQQGPTSSFAGINECQVSPVVEITFQHTTICTNASSGPNPCWNQDLQWEFRPPNDDFSLANLQTIKEVIYFNLYDEVVIDILEDSRDRESQIHHRIERHWLGTLQIPFLTLYLNTRIEGTFKVACPPFLLGYTRNQKSPSTRFASPSHFGLTPLEKDHTYLTVFITLEPTLPLPESLKEKFDSNESAKLLQRADTLKTAFLNNHPKREVKTTVIDVTGKSMFVTRFLRPLPPPEELLAPEISDEDRMSVVARFVSLIPVISDVVIFPGICDIWTTSEQFLSMLAGDQEEHAVLLCNYFLYLKKQAWLILGFAIPEGPTIYVLTQENSEFKIWNPCTGEYFSANDSFCPMQIIGSTINQENIWLNIQQSGEPARITFDFANKKNWQPFFDVHFPNPGISSIQPEMIVYQKTEQAYVDKLREKIDRMLRNRIMQWRERHRTSWNRHCGQILYKVLLKMEKVKYNALNEEEINSELQNIIGVYKMCGFPLCMPYTDMATISETVFATGVHRIESSNVEFALSVHIQSYPQNIVAVWIYVASLCKR